LLFAKSTDGGSSWTTSTIDAVAATGAHSSIAAPTGTSTIYVSYCGQGACSGLGGILNFAKSTNGGVSWTTSTIDSGTGLTGFYTSITAPSGTSTIYVSYQDGVLTDLRFAKSTSGGEPASFAAGEDTPITGLDKDTTKRLRLEVSNEGTASLAAQYRLEYATGTGGPWTQVGPAADWVMADSTYLTDAASTTNVAGGLFDENITFLAGQVKDTGSETASITLGTTNFTELEYSIAATSTAPDGQTYYFRVTNAGATTNFVYQVYASATLAATANITIAGTCKQYDRTTNCSNGLAVKAASGGTLLGQSTTTASGAWTIFDIPKPSSGAVITAFLDGVAASGRGAAVTKYDGSGNISGLEIYEKHLTIGSTGDNPTVTNADLSSYDNSSSTDADVFFDVDADNNLILDANSNFTDEVFLIKSGNNTYRPDSTGAGKRIYTHHFRNNGTTTADGVIWRVGGDWFSNGTYTQGTSTIEMASSSAVLDTGGTLYNLTASSSASITASSSLTVSNILDAEGTLNINSGKTVTAPGTITLNGTISGAGTLVIPDTSSGPGTTGTLSSIVRYSGPTANIASSTLDARTYGGLVEIYVPGRTAYLSTGSYNFNGGLNIISDGAGASSLNAAQSNPTVNISGAALDFAGAVPSGTILSGTGTWSASTSVDFTAGTYTAASGNTFVLNGSGQTLTANSNSFSNLNLTPSGGTLTLADSNTVSGNLSLGGAGTVSAGATTLTMTGTSATLTGGGKTLNNLTVDSGGTVTLDNSDLTVGGTLNIAGGTLSLASGRTLTHSGSTLTLGGTISGIGKLIYQSGTAFPSGGTISSVLRFDSTNNDQTMGARTYGGAVELYNGEGTNRAVTMAAGVQTLSSHLTLFAAGGGNITLDAATNNPTVGVTGNTAYSGAGGGSEIVSASSTWTNSGDLTISGGTFTAPSSTLSIGGNYTNNNGTFTHNSGTILLNGSSQQTLAGTLSGSSAFNKLQINNNSGGEATPSVIIGATTTATTFVATTTSSTIRFNASSTYTFTNFTINGQNTTNRILLRSSASPANWLLNVAEAGSQSVSYVDVKDSDASGGNEVSAGDGTSVNSGGNSNWAFTVTAPGVTSTAADVFEINAASTTIADVTVTSGGGSPGGRITATNNIRLRIPDSFPAVFDSSTTTITCVGGDACGKISLTGVTYESSTKIAVIDVVTSFANGENVVISGLRFANFSAVKASTTVHRARVDGAADASDDATDSQVKAIKGKLVEEDHGQSQLADNKFDIEGGSITNTELFRYRLTPTGENMNMATTTISLSAVGFDSGNITSAALFNDTNGDGDVDGGEPQLGNNCSATISGEGGTITCGGTSTVTGATNVILRASISSIDEGDSLTFSLAPADVVGVKGATTVENITVSGSSNSKNHGKPVKLRGGGSAFGGAPPEVGSQGGGTPGGGDSGAPGGGDQGGGDQGGGGGGAPLLFCNLFPGNPFCKPFEIKKEEADVSHNASGFFSDLQERLNTLEDQLKTFFRRP
ncbi:MAG: hypothetical protein UY26_C0003G0327, partial [Candidatus Jorgensenbacteria bacterium GW2011_GWA1_48_13]